MTNIRAPRDSLDWVVWACVHIEDEAGDTWLLAVPRLPADSREVETRATLAAAILTHVAAEITPIPPLSGLQTPSLAPTLLVREACLQICISPSVS